MLQVVLRDKATIDVTYSTVCDLNFKLRQKETDRFVEQVKHMNDEERRTYRQLKNLGLTSLGFSANERNRYNRKRYQEETSLRARQEEAEQALWSAMAAFDKEDDGPEEEKDAPEAPTEEAEEMPEDQEQMEGWSEEEEDDG